MSREQPDLHPIPGSRNIGGDNQVQPLRLAACAQPMGFLTALHPITTPDLGSIQEDILAHELPPLPYDYAALEPHIDT